MDLHDELVAIYGYYLEISQALIKWCNFLKHEVASPNQTHLGNRMSFGRVNPNDPNASYQYVRTVQYLINASEKNGITSHIHRRSVIALAYAIWEDRYRNRIAKECNLAHKNEMKSDVFYDLNKYRQAILHGNGKLDKEPKVIRFFKKGDVVSLSDNQMNELFSTLIEELNRIGKTYYHRDPQFSLDKPLNNPA